MGIDTKIYELRKKAGLSQEELGFQLNVTRQTVSKWETGQSLPEIDKVNGLCDLFGISADELLREKAIPAEEVNLTVEKQATKKIPYLTLATIAFVSAIFSIPLMNELKISNNIEAIIVGIFIVISIFFLIKYFLNRKK